MTFDRNRLTSLIDQPIGATCRWGLTWRFSRRRGHLRNVACVFSLMNCDQSIVAQVVPEDVQRILSLAERIWKPTFRPILPPDRLDYLYAHMYDRQKLDRQLRDHTQAYYIMNKDERDIGYAQLVYDADNVKLEKLYLLPEVQGQGCGVYLLTVLVKMASEANMERIRLQVNRGNARAIRFYETFGFRIIASKDFDVGGGHVMDDYIMEMTL